MHHSPVEPVGLYSDLGRELSTGTHRGDALIAVTRLAADRVPGTDRASITEGRRGRVTTVAATDDTARAVDELQYHLGTGPGLDAILHDLTVGTDDLRTDDRWPIFGRLAAERHQVRSILSLPLHLHHDNPDHDNTDHDDPDHDDRIAALNLYSTRTSAFGDTAEILATLIATHGALAIAAATAREHATHLHRALRNSRKIGMALGVLMATHNVTQHQAFTLLRIASQHTNRKLADIAADVADTGTLDLPRGN